LTAPSCALQDKAQAARPRYRSDIGQSAEGKKPPSALASLPSMSAPFPQPLHAVALHGSAKSRYAIKRSPFAGCWCSGNLDVPLSLDAVARRVVMR